METRWEIPEEKRLSSEQLEAVLLSIRTGASASLTEMAVEGVTGGDEHDAKIEDVRAVWHAAEVALGVLNDHYLPKREAIEDVRERLEHWAD